MDNTSIIIAECITLRNDTIAAKDHEFLNLEIKDNLKIALKTMSS